MANKTVTVKPSGGTYTTLAAAIAGEVTANANLVTMEGILNIEIGGTWSSADTATVDLNGFTTNASYYVNVYTDTANRAKASGWDTGRYILNVENNFAIRIRDDYVRIDGLQLTNNSPSANGRHVVYSESITATNNDIRVINCRIRGHGDATYKQDGIRCGDVDEILTVYNTIIENVGPSLDDSIGIRSANGGSATLYNNTVYNCRVGIRKVAGTVTIKNCAVFNCTDDFANSPDTIDFCASDDNDTTGTNVAESGGGAAWPDDFTGAATGDFTLKSTSNLVGAGADDPGSGLFSTDIDGNTRADWDVGAHEYVAAASSAFNELYMMFEA